MGYIAHLRKRSLSKIKIPKSPKSKSPNSKSPDTSPSKQSLKSPSEASIVPIPNGDTSLSRTSKVDFSKPLNYDVVKNKTAIVADGANGPALGIATKLAEHGAYVAICDSNEEAGQAAQESLTSKGYHVKFIKTDTSTWESQRDAFNEVLEWNGNHLDIVVTSPGIVTNNLLMSILPKHGTPTGEPLKPPTKTLAVDLMGVYFTTSLALFYFNQLHARTQPQEFQPQLVFICSMAGYDGLHFGTDYAAAKHGVRAIWKTTRRPRPGMAKYQSNLLAPTYIRKNTISKDEKKMQNHNTQTKDIADVVEGAMRCICDDNVEGRAICCCQGAAGIPGELNFDLCDDLVDFNGGKELRQHADGLWMPSRATLSEDSNCAMQ